MRALLQRVTEARVTVDGDVIGEIGNGLLVFLGVTHDDLLDDVSYLTSKIANLRIFEDANGAMNRSALDLVAEDASATRILLVSQFTLYADARKGRRPSFVNAARPEQAEPLVEAFAHALRELGFTVEQGRFGADMKVALVNDGPVTIWLDTAELRG